MLLKINGSDYQINADECAKIPHDKFNFLVIRDSVGTLERIVSLINEIGNLNIETILPLIWWSNFSRVKCSIQCYRRVEPVTSG